MAKTFFNVSQKWYMISCIHNGKLVGSRICSIEWCHFQSPWITCRSKDRLTQISWENHYSALNVSEMVRDRNTV